MSIYSGFPTRKDQTNYNQLVSKLIQLLQAHLLQVLPPEKLSSSKITSYAKVITKMQQYEQHKYLPPKFSKLLHPLSSLIGLPSKLDCQSTDEINYETPKQKYKTINTNSPSEFNYQIKDKFSAKFQNNQQKQSIEIIQHRKSKKYPKGSDSIAKRKQYKYHASFYEIQQQKLKKLHEKYQHKAKQLNQKINSDEDGLKLHYRSQTQSPAEIYKSIKSQKYDPASKYGIIHMKALKEAQQQVRAMKNSTPKRQYAL